MSGEMDTLSNAGDVRLRNCINAAGDKLRQLMQSWDDRLHEERLALPEDYLNGRVAFVVKLKLAQRIHCYYADLQSCLNDEAAIVHSQSSPRQRNILQGDDGHGGEQQQMFNHNVQIVQSPKGVVPSLVRFDLIEYCRDDGGSRHLYTPNRTSCTVVPPNPFCFQ